MYNLKFTLAFCFLLGFTLYAEARVGGGYLEPVASNDPEVKSLANWAADKLHGTLIKVTDAQRQIVAGWLYHIGMQMENKRNQTVTCSVRVWIRHWINSVKLVKAKCRPVSV